MLVLKVPLICNEFDMQFPDWSLEITQGGRSSAEQHALYAQGRLPLSVVNMLRLGVQWEPITDAENIIVTNADAGESWHQYFCAADVAPESKTGVDWDGSDEHWEFILAAIERHTLMSGRGWKDEPHIQPAGIPLSPTSQTRYLFLSGGLPAVWETIPSS